MAAAQQAHDNRIMTRMAAADRTNLDYFFPEQSGFGATSIAPSAFNPGGVASNVVSVPWEGTGGPDDPAFKALMDAAAARYVENFAYDPSRGGFTTQPGARARIAEAIRQATN
jgi:hypothetical protein